MRFLLTLVVVLLPVQLLAQRPIVALKPVVAPIVQDGLDTYRARDAEAAIAVWTRGWDQSDSAKVRQLRESLHVLEENYGRMQGYDVVRTTQPGSRINRNYVILYFEGRPLYAFFHAYQIPGGTWKVIDMTWNTNWKEVMPPDVLGE